MPDFALPEYALRILVRLHTHGYAAYLVGGCVRDLLMGRTPEDYDICTAALPEQTLALFPDALTVGLKHGTLIVRVEGGECEVTTFRTDGTYTDHRRPDSVRFVEELRLDLARRDFTVNAMAMSPDGTVSDPFGGAADIRAKRIRCVGDPTRRFEEDALRMLRAYRFAAKLDFRIDGETLDALRSKAYLAEKVSPERACAELGKLLMTEHAELIFELMAVGLTDRYLLRRPSDGTVFAILPRLPALPAARWGVTAYLLLSQGCIGSAEEFLASLRMSTALIRAASDVAEALRHPELTGRADVKRLVRRCGEETALCAAACLDTLYDGEREVVLRSAFAAGECCTLRQLAVDGRELAALGLQGREIGMMLDRLLEHVLDTPEDNRRELLLGLAQEWIRKG